MSSFARNIEPAKSLRDGFRFAVCGGDGRIELHLARRLRAAKLKERGAVEDIITNTRAGWTSNCSAHSPVVANGDSIPVVTVAEARGSRTHL